MLTQKIVDNIRRRLGWRRWQRWLFMPLFARIRYTKHGAPDRLGFHSLTILGHRPHAPLRSDVEIQQERAQRNIFAYLTEYREKK